jgi:predicted dehydrogenase
MRETAIHDIDLALWFTGSHVLSAHGYKRHAQGQAEADSCLAVARLECGTICSFASSWLGRDASPAGVDARMKIIGTKGEIEIALPSRSYTAIDDSAHRFTEPAIGADPLVLMQSPLRAEIECFLQRVRGNAQAPIVTAQEALQALRTAVLLDESCETIL